MFAPTKLAGVWVVTSEAQADERGWFMRAWCRDELAARGLEPQLAQCSLSHNRQSGTFRGMHYQAAPHGEAKLVRCIRGRVWDIALDLRPDSPTRYQWVAEELTAENGRALYIPPGCAHGFQTLADDSELLYCISEPFRPEAARGVAWHDPAFQLRLPLPVSVISARDQAYPACQDLGSSL